VNIDAYLKRIAYCGQREPTLATLTGLQRAMLTTVPYEAIDVYRQMPVGLDLAAIYDKIVARGRGGWCFEMNSLLHWALSALGFDAVRLNSSVGVTDPADYDVGGHMLLRVMLDGAPWLADVGFGNAFLDPIPLRFGTHRQYFYDVALRPAMKPGYAIFDTHIDGGAGYVINLSPADTATFEPACAAYQADPGSSWRRRLTCLIYTSDGGYHEQRGAVAAQVTAAGKRTWTLNSRDALAARLRDDFKLPTDDLELDALWAKVSADHAAWSARGIA
jgi:N-hydroxyarylamine O-acetyltransferase